MAKPFSERLKTGLESGRMTVETRRELIEETRLERDRQLALHQQAEADASDPLLADADRDEAGKTADRAKRLVRGYDDALVKLEELLTLQVESDKHQKAEAERKAATAERDEIAAEWEKDGQAALEILIGLNARTVANAARMRLAGVNEPNAEATARGVPGNFYIGVNPVDQLTKMKIPVWTGAGRRWPVDQHSAMMAKILQDQSAAAKAATEARKKRFGKTEAAA